VRLLAEAVAAPVTAAFVSRGAAPPVLAPPVAAVLPLIPSYDRLIGTTIDGRYQIEEKLGEGGMGIVFRAHHTVIEKTVAIKFLKREVARDHSVLQRFLQEAKSASRIGHPNIVDVTDFGTLPDASVYFVMEYMDGTTLARAVRQGTLRDPAKALPVVAQIARALSAAHQKGIVHRDLKPENIFLLQREGRSDFVKIMDFGIAKVSPLEGNDDHGPRLTRAGTIFGTPEYMAPEQAQGRSDIDHRVDIYALGTILYEMLVGRVPHRGETLVATLAMQMLDPVIPPSEAAPDAQISRELESVVLKALAKEREERYASMGELLSALERAAGDIVLYPAPLSQTGAARILGTRPGTPAGAAGPKGVLPERPAAATVPYAPPGSAPPRVAASTLPSVPKTRSRTPWIGLGILVVGAALAAVFLRTTPKQDMAPQAALPEADAGLRTALVLDAAPAIPAPKTRPGVLTAPTTQKPRDSALVVLPSAPDGGTLGVKVTVRTDPKGGDLFEGKLHLGSDGMTFDRPIGTRTLVRCRLAGYLAGRVELNFDGGVTEIVCPMAKLKPKCVRDLKNPFDTCPE
jgi:serine/threonine-protein kinase